MRRVEIGRRGGRIGADQVVVVIDVDHRGEHVLARELVTPVGHEALLVAIIDRRDTAQRQQHGMAQHHALQQFVGARTGICLLHEHREAAHVVVAEEGRELQRRGRPPLVQHIAIEQPFERGGSGCSADRIDHRARKAEVEHRWQSGDARVARQRSGVDRVVIDFPEDVEIRNPPRFRPRQHRGHEGLPEFGVHMLRGVDAESVDPERVDPAAIDVDEALHDLRILGREIV